MNTEQVEGQLNEYKDKLVSISVPIRGTCHMTFYGNLSISENWESGDNFILFSVRYWPDCDINFRAQDVMKITPHNPIHDLHGIHASILLKTEDWMAVTNFQK